MSATAIILLVGVVSFWTAAVVMGMFLLRFRKTLETLENTLNHVRSDLNELTPAVSGTLREVEKTGQEMGQTAAEVRILAKKVNAGSTPTAISGAVSYLPAVMGLVRLVAPMFRRKQR